MRAAWWCVTLVALATAAASAQEPTELETLREQRKAFQDQTLTTARPFGFIFNAGDPPRIIWRDVDGVRRLGGSGDLAVRWFDGQLQEAQVPSDPGRWIAWVEGRAPNGTPVRRSLTFYCRPKGFLWYTPPPFETPLAYQKGPIEEAVWREHEAELRETWQRLLLGPMNDTEAGAALIAGLAEAEPLGREARPSESAAARAEAHHLALKLRVHGLEDAVRELAPPRRRADDPAPALHTGTMAEAGMAADAPQRIEAVCRKWAEETGVPFVTLVARHGVIVTHAAFGRDESGEPIGLDYRGDLASITKTLTAILFSRFVDQGLIGLDDPVSTVFPDFPRDSPHVPTFRQCLTHTSGLSGHGSWGGARNPNFENIILNGIDVNRPGEAYTYTGMGFDLAAAAMSLVSGKSFAPLYEQELFEPLGLEGVPIEQASTGAKLTAFELGVFAQWLANRGSYGDRAFIRPETFEQMLPRPLGELYPGIEQTEGIGMHWMRHVRAAAELGSTRPEDQIFSERTIGHGSLFSCVLLVDLERDLVIVQVRRKAGENFGQWSRRFYETIVDAADAGDDAGSEPAPAAGRS